MVIFNIRMKGTNKMIPIEAINKKEALRKFIQLVNSKKMFVIPDAQLRPNTVNNSRRLFRGVK